MTDEPVFRRRRAATSSHEQRKEGMEHIVGDRGFFGQPRGLATLFFTEMWERFSFYGIRPLLILYMTAALLGGGFGFDRTTAAAIVGIYSACVYLASLPGGWIADRWLGLQRAIWTGGILIALGHLSIALSALFAHQAFYLGLILIVMGTGLLKPNISALVADLYPEGGARRDAGFSIFYMGINVGALIAPLVTGTLGERVGWHWGFGAAGVGMLAGLITFRARAQDTLGTLGSEPSGTPAQQNRVRAIALSALALLTVAVALAMVGVIAIDPVVIANRMVDVILWTTVLYFGYLFLFAGLTSAEKRNIVVVLALFIAAVVFWAAFEQAPTSLNLFARDFTDRTVAGWEVPTTWLQSINSLFVILLAPVMGALWVALGRRDMDLSSPAKFSVGLLLTGIGFYLMVVASNHVIAGGTAVRVSMWWLTASYLFQSVGELALSPVGLSSMTKLAPRRFVGQMMGLWFTAAALGNLIAGLVGGNVDPEKLGEMPVLFERTALSLFIAAAILVVLIVPIRKMMGRAEGVV